MSSRGSCWRPRSCPLELSPRWQVHHFSCGSCGVRKTRDIGEHMSTEKKKVKKGLVIVNTGNGKGKSTSALGILLRAWGRGFRVCVVQFIKAETGQWGEIKAAKKLGIDWFTTGDGFTWTSKDMDETIERARHGWELAKEKILSKNYDLIILDEFTYTLHYGWLNNNEVIDWLKSNKPQDI